MSLSVKLEFKSGKGRDHGFPFPGSQRLVNLQHGIKNKNQPLGPNHTKKIKGFIYGSDPNISSLKTFRKNHAMNFVTSWGKRVGGWGVRQGGLEMLGCAWESSWCGGVNHPGQPLSGWPDHAAPLSKQEFHNPHRREPV